MADGLLPRFVKRPGRIVSVLCAGIAVAAGVVAWSPDAGEGLREALPGQVTDGGFATSGACEKCHPGPYGAWHQSYHRTMTQAATPSAVQGRFDGVTLEDRGFQWRLERRGDEFWAEMPDPAWFDRPPWFMQMFDENWPDAPPTIEARMVMTTGSHHMQNYWIRRPGEAERPALGPDDGALVQFPWVWLISQKRWVPNQDSFLSPPSSALNEPARWNAACSQCHSVATQPRESDDQFDTRSVELGIACEACHGPGERHVRFYRSPFHRYVQYVRRSLGDEGPDPTIVNPARLEPHRSIETCGQCHSFGMWRNQEEFRGSGFRFRAGDQLDKYRSVFQYTEDPQDPLLLDMLDSEPLALDGRFWRDGTIRVTGREYNGLLASTHYTSSELTCLSCHAMHEYQATDDQLALEVSGNASCTSCHTEYEEDVSAHTHHAGDSSGSECMNCHMPNTTYGLFSAMRSHRIDNPSVQVSLESGRPNACNLCHLDQTLDWTSRYLNQWYGQPLVELGEDERSIAAAVLWVLKGDAVQRTILGWHMGWRPAQEVSSRAWMAPYLAQLLTDPYSAARQVAYQSLVTLPGFGDFEYDYAASPSARAEKANQALVRWHGTWAAGPGESGARLLIDPDGSIHVDDVLRLLAERDQRPLSIIE